VGATNNWEDVNQWKERRLFKHTHYVKASIPIDTLCLRSLAWDYTWLPLTYCLGNSDLGIDLWTSALVTYESYYFWLAFGMPYTLLPYPLCLGNWRKGSDLRLGNLPTLLWNLCLWPHWKETSLPSISPWMLALWPLAFTFWTKNLTFTLWAVRHRKFAIVHSQLELIPCKWGGGTDTG